MGSGDHSCFPHDAGLRAVEPLDCYVSPGTLYSLLACALWPMVAFVVPEHQLGTAYGFMQSIQNHGLAVISITAGMILDTRGYLFLEVFFIACVSFSLLSVVLLYLVKRAQGGNLNYSARQREEMKLSHAE